MTPGVRSIHVIYDPFVPQAQMLAALASLEQSLGAEIPTTVPTRTITLPLVFEHSSTLAAVERYGRTIRADAPWLPNNVDFLQKINGLSDRNIIKEIVVSATFLVLGLGDVFFGAPCAVPLDPRHRLFGTKYNPPRSFTPDGTVGIGGQYMCIYGMDSPGGYQLIGRTVPIWNRWAKRENAWMFQVFDQIKFHIVSEAELDAAREAGVGDELVKIQNEKLDLVSYEAWVNENIDQAETAPQKRLEFLKEAGLLDDLIQAYKPKATIDDQWAEEVDKDIKGELVRSEVAGRCWKCTITEGDLIQKGQELICIEAMKMEIKILAPWTGRCTKVYVKVGDTLDSGSRIAVVNPVFPLEGS